MEAAIWVYAAGVIVVGMVASLDCEIRDSVPLIALGWPVIVLFSMFMSAAAVIWAVMDFFIAQPVPKRADHD